MLGWSKVKHLFGASDRRVPRIKRASKTDRTRFAEMNDMPAIKRPYRSAVALSEDHYEFLSESALVLDGLEFLDINDASLDRTPEGGWAVFFWVRIQDQASRAPVVLFSSAPHSTESGNILGPAVAQLNYDPIEMCLHAEFWTTTKTPLKLTARLSTPLGKEWTLVGMELAHQGRYGVENAAIAHLVTLSVNGTVVKHTRCDPNEVPASLGAVLRFGGGFVDTRGSAVGQGAVKRPDIELANVSLWHCQFNPMRRSWMHRATFPVSGTSLSVADEVSKYMASGKVRPVGLWLCREVGSGVSPNRIGASPARLNRNRQFRLGPRLA
jgi:hypothetical protein